MGPESFVIEVAILAVSAFSALLALFLLFRSHQSNTSANYLLMLWLGIFTVLAIMFFLIITRLIIFVPWLYRVPSPLYYLAFPAVWLYVRMILEDKTMLYKTDLIHAIPALLHLIELIPFYFSGYDEKVATISADLHNPLGAFRHAEGWFPQYLHNIFRGIQAIGYAMAMGWILHQFRSRGGKPTVEFAPVVKWLKTITVLQGAFGATMILLLTAESIGPASWRSFWLYVLLAVYIIFWSTYLLFHPNVLLAMPRLALLTLANKVPDDNTQVVPVLDKDTNMPSSTGSQLMGQEPELQAPAISDTSILPIDYHLHWKELEQFMLQQKPFLVPRYSMSQLSMDLKIPRHHLAYLLNHVMHIRFTDYINQHRINYLQHQIANGALQNHTLEALAQEAGFNSRITFIRAVQRSKGQNPSTFFKLPLE